MTTTAQTSTATIRVATEADLDRIVEMCRAFVHALPAWRDRVADDPEHVRATALSVIDHGRVFLATTGEETIGLLAAIVFTHPVTNHRIGAEVIWWVEPAARRTGAGRALFEAAESWATAEGATAMQGSAYRDAPLGRLYERWGYQPMELVYQKTLT